MAETFSVSTGQDIAKLLLLCKRTIYPFIFELVVQFIPQDVEEQDHVLVAQLAWLRALDPMVVCDGMKVDKRLLLNPVVCVLLFTHFFCTTL